MRLRRWLIAVPSTVMVAGVVGTSMATVPAASPSRVTAGQAPFSATGPHAVGVRTLAGSDALPGLTHWYPTAAGNAKGMTYDQELHLGGPFGAVTVGRVHGTATGDAPAADIPAPPLIVLAPGYGVGARSYAWLAEHLASHGFAVVAHDATETLGSAAGDGLWKAAADRPKTLRAVVRDLAGRSAPGGPDEDQWDPDRIAVLGHSFGGYSALAIGGARLDSDAFAARCGAGDPDAAFPCKLLLPNIEAIAARRGLDAVPDGLWPSHREELVDAIVTLAGDAYLFDASGLASLSVPVLAVGGSDDGDTPWALGPEMTFEHAGSSRRVLVGLQGAEHMVFTGRCDQQRRIVPLVPMDLCEDADGRRSERHDVIAHVTTAFLLEELAGDDDAHAALARGAVELPSTTYEATGGSDDD